MVSDLRLLVVRVHLAQLAPPRNLHILKTFTQNVRVNSKPELLPKRMPRRKNSLPPKLQSSLPRLPRPLLRLPGPLLMLLRKRLPELEGKHGKLR